MASFLCWKYSVFDFHSENFQLFHFELIGACQVGFPLLSSHPRWQLISVAKVRPSAFHMHIYFYPYIMPAAKQAQVFMMILDSKLGFFNSQLS